MKMKKIKLMEEPYWNGGIQMGCNLFDEWYEASAEDEQGNIYKVLWEIRTDYDYNTENEDSICNWYTPFAILDENGNHLNIDDYDIE
jgi:hypothetical protein